MEPKRRPKCFRNRFGPQGRFLEKKKDESCLDVLGIMLGSFSTYNLNAKRASRKANAERKPATYAITLVCLWLRADLIVYVHAAGRRCRERGEGACEKNVNNERKNKENGNCQKKEEEEEQQQQEKAKPGEAEEGRRKEK